ncbi:PpiC-type peptidyl-prolyl cis-trans isomerase [Nitritalea halalkaliphila LW7]|uniref:Periplasmic chaperone PpiD n=1 Tax=Nitritalea halalkaliphila LW7 TaxID=1189621 RepID=I5BYX1_9BACT|nr:peptidylprolyl isomerase [Nitritalea halalkaliphila]EIM74773.1 PpiC-type peptidyl-prolyl cis-trans isomerase [Nitritalea halalkaliphila LW7]
MALIKKIRQKTGLAIGVIAVGLIFFLVGGDILSPNSTLLGGTSNKVGEIAGESITYEEYMAAIEEAKFVFQNNTGRSPSDAEMFSIREQAWQALIVERVFQKQYDALGMMVSDAELVDMVQGRNIIPELRQSLTNPETGEFDRSQLIAFLQSLDGAGPEQRAFWAQQEQTFANARLRLKYDNLLATSEFANSKEGRMEHIASNSVADVDLVFIPFYALEDATVEVTDAEIKRYYDANKEKFRVDKAADLEYVRFDMRPSAEDSAAVRDEILRLTEELKGTTQDSVFVLRNSDMRRPFLTVLPGDNLPETLRLNVDEIEAGETYGPFLSSRSTFVSYKITDKFDGTPRMRARHILFGTQGLDDSEKEVVRERARGILAEIKDGLEFAAAAAQYGEDGTSQRGGDLGWFAKEDFVDEFANAVFAARNTGLLNDVVETEYGFHIISVTEMPKSETHKIAVLERELGPSDATRNEAFRNADLFAATANDKKSFEALVEQEGYRRLQANGLAPFSRNLNNLQNAREVIRWAFNDASEGKVSPVFELDDTYVVALLVSRTDEGYASLANVRNEILAQLRNEKKGEKIKEQLAGLESFDAMKEKFDEFASRENVADLRLSSNVLPGVGFAPKAIGAIFGMAEGKIGAPILEENGVIIARVNSRVDAGEIADYTNYQRQLAASSSQRTAYMIMMALEELADVKDFRYKFF